MTIAKIDKWTAFAGSLALPGLGQLIAGRWSSLCWLSAGIGVVSVADQLAAPSYASAAGLIAVALCSAEHAKRLLERRSANHSIVHSQVRIGPRRRRAISIRLEVVSTLPAAKMWRRVSDLPDFLTIDPFHERVTLMRAEPRAGVDLALHHNAFGWRFVRFGRILQWREGTSFAFSDLSRHDGRSQESARRRRGFPHVFFVEVIPAGDNRCRLAITVRGKWTSRLVPLAIARPWLRWVFQEHARLLSKAL